MKTLVLGLVLLLVASDSFAQITITKDEYLNSYGEGGQGGTVYRSENPSGLSTYVQTSALGSTWDFSSVVFTDSSASNWNLVAYPGGAPLADDPDFQTATNVLISYDSTDQSTTYLFMRITDDGQWALGTSMMKDGATAKIGTYKPPYQWAKLPLAYQSSWKSASDFSGPFLPAGEKDTIEVDVNVDSYGTIILPGGRSEATLRIPAQTITTEHAPGQPVEISRAPQYQWFTKSGAVVTIYMDLDGNPTGIQYTVPKASSSGVAEEQNAADRALQVFSGNGISLVTYSLANSMPIRLTVSDVTGRVVETLADGPASAGQHTSQISTSTLPDGMYFVHLYGNGVSATQKMMVQR